MKYVKDANGEDAVVQAGESANIYASFVFNKVAITKDMLISLTATLYDRGTNYIINSRSDQDILDAHDGTVATDGKLTLRLGPADNALQGTPDVGEDEVHVLRLKWTWSDGIKTRTGIEELAFYCQALATPAAPPP